MAEGKWTGSQRTETLTSVDGHTRLYGRLQWERPGKWTGQRCEASWWLFAATDGGKFQPIMARQNFLAEGETAFLVPIGFSPQGRWVAADVILRRAGVAEHGYFVADLQAHTSCFGSAAKALDGVRSNLGVSGEPLLQRLTGVEEDGWVRLTVDPATPQAGPWFEPCSGKVRLEREP